MKAAVSAEQLQREKKNHVGASLEVVVTGNHLKAADH